MTWYVQVQNQAYGPYTDQQMHSFVAEGRITEISLITADPRSGYFHAKAYEYYQFWSQSRAEIQSNIGEKSQNAAQDQIEQTQMAVGGQSTISQPNSVYSNPYQAVPHNTPVNVQASNAQAPNVQAPNAQVLNTQPSSNTQASGNPVPEPIHDLMVDVSPSISTPISTPPHNQSQSDAAYRVFLVMAEIRSEGAMGFLKSLQEFGIAQRIGDTVWLVRSKSGVEQMRNVLSQSLSRQDRLFILDSQESKTAWFNIGADLDNRIRELWSLDDE